MGRKMTFLEYLEAEEAKGNELTAVDVINHTNHEFGNDPILDNMLEDWLEHNSEDLNEEMSWFMKSYSSHCSTLYIVLNAIISDEQMYSNMKFTSTACRRSCAVLEKNHFHPYVPTHILKFWRLSWKYQQAIF